jgi:hypothetical protein
MAKTDIPDDATKRPNSKTGYSEDDLSDLDLCVESPLYFMKTFMRVQHPIRGALPFIPYPFQERIINGIHTHRFTTALTARQMGKCSTFDTNIIKDEEQIKIGSLLRFSLRERLVNLLEKYLIKLSLL